MTTLTPETDGAIPAQSIRLDGHLDLPDPARFDAAAPNLLRSGGVNAVVATIRANVRPAAELSSGLHDLEAGRAQIAKMTSGEFTLARTPGDVRSAAAEGEIALILELQNLAAIESLDELQPWLDDGVSVVAPVFIGNNRWAGSSRPYPFASRPIGTVGLSGDGEDLVRFLNRNGALIDVSQLSDLALDDVLRLSTAPVVATHSGLRRQIDAERNLSDNTVRRIADRGGLIQVVGFGTYLREVPAAVVPGLAALWEANGLAVPSKPTGFYSIDDPATAEWDADRFFEFLHEFHVVFRLDEPEATVDDLVDAVEGAIDVAGIDHVGISSDFNHGGGIVGWMNAAETGHVVDTLLDRGFSSEDIDQVFGGNFLRIWGETLANRKENQR